MHREIFFSLDCWTPFHQRSVRVGMSLKVGGKVSVLAGLATGSGMGVRTGADVWSPLQLG